MNIICLIGRLTADPELRYTNSGTAVAQFALAVDRQYKQDNQPTADFINIVAWQKTGELAASYLRKGSQAAVQGRLQIRSYDDKEGRKVYVAEVVADQVRFLDPKQSQSGGNQSDSGNQSGGFGKDPFKDDGKPIDISSDDLPF